MARIPLGALSTLNTSTQLDPMFTELYDGVTVADAAVAHKWKAATGRVRLRPYVDATNGAFIEATDTAESAYVPFSFAGATMRFTTSAGLTFQLDALGNIIHKVNTAAPALATNGQMVFALTSNTNLRISVRGSDGTTRVANITLA